MKRKLPLVVAFIIALGLTLLIGGTAEAKTKPSPAPSTTQVGNVSVSYYTDYYTGQPVFYASVYDPTPEDPYNWSPCAQDTCGGIVITTGKRASAKLQQVSGEQFVSGWYSYESSDHTHYTGGVWDGSSLLMTVKVRVGNAKPWTGKLASAYASLYLPGHPVPPSSPCCK